MRKAHAIAHDAQQKVPVVSNEPERLSHDDKIERARTKTFATLKEFPQRVALAAQWNALRFHQRDYGRITVCRDSVTDRLMQIHHDPRDRRIGVACSNANLSDPSSVTR